VSVRREKIFPHRKTVHRPPHSPALPVATQTLLWDSIAKGAILRCLRRHRVQVLSLVPLSSRVVCHGSGRETMYLIIAKPYRP
jgi:hypothetical protein